MYVYSEPAGGCAGLGLNASADVRNVRKAGVLIKVDQSLGEQAALKALLSRWAVGTLMVICVESRVHRLVRGSPFSAGFTPHCLRLSMCYRRSGKLEIDVKDLRVVPTVRQVPRSEC